MKNTSSSVQYICKCGSVCSVEIIRSWIYVTCNNKMCKEFGKKQLPIWGKHTVKQPEVTI